MPVVIVVEVLLLLAVLFVVAAVVAGRGGGMPEATRDGAEVGFPTDRPLRGEDLHALRFSMALRGYRMAEVDDALDRLAAELAQRDDRIAALEQRAGPAPEPRSGGSVVVSPDE